MEREESAHTVTDEAPPKELDDLERKEMLEFINREEKDLEEDIQLENNLNIPNAYDDLEPWHFPLFLTVKKLIYMMDACLSYSFFSRDH